MAGRCPLSRERWRAHVCDVIVGRLLIVKSCIRYGCQVRCGVNRERVHVKCDGVYMPPTVGSFVFIRVWPTFCYGRKTSSRKSKLVDMGGCELDFTPVIMPSGAFATQCVDSHFIIFTCPWPQ